MFLAGGPFGLGAPELLIILAVVVIIFGGARLADLGGSMGKGIREFKKNVKEPDEEDVVQDTKKSPTPVQNLEAPNTPTEEESAVTSTIAPVQALKCPNCGTLNAGNARVCNQCGTALASPVT